MAVVLESARRDAIKFDDLVCEAGLSLAGASVKIGEQVRLLGLLKKLLGLRYDVRLHWFDHMD